MSSEVWQYSVPGNRQALVRSMIVVALSVPWPNKGPVLPALAKFAQGGSGVSPLVLPALAKFA